MNIDFELILTLLVLVCGVFWIYDVLVWTRHNKGSEKTKPIILEWFSSFFVPLLLVLLIRSFIIEPFRIPSGSLRPTLLDGDFILVNKYQYGLRLPVLHNKFLPISEPKNGDILVFHWPPDPSIEYIKRVIGVPGDRISYKNKVVYVNGKPQTQTFVDEESDSSGERTWPVNKMTENLLGFDHSIYINAAVPVFDVSEFVVPPGHYFVMGDNRDNSEDSRFWGFVPEENIVGRAFFIWFSWRSDPMGVRFSRIGKIH